MVFTNARGEIRFTNRSRDCDLSDVFLLNSKRRQVTTYLAMTIGSSQPRHWDEATLESIENHIRYQFRFEGYRVRITRLSPTPRTARPCSEAFRWKLVMRTLFLPGEA